ncbi:hypothetical protein D3C72_1948220 [compost metagenome]
MAGYAGTPERRRATAAELYALGANGTLQVEIGQRHALADAGAAQAAQAARQTTGSTILLP